MCVILQLVIITDNVEDDVWIKEARLSGIWHTVLVLAVSISNSVFGK